MEQLDFKEVEQIKNRLSLQENELEKRIFNKHGIDSLSMSKDIEEGEQLLKQYCSICFSNGSTHPDRYRLNQYLYNVEFTKDKFNSLKQIDHTLVKKLKLIHLALGKITSREVIIEKGFDILHI